MPNRDYFDLRYAIPGFTFLLIVIMINFVPLIAVISKNNIDSTLTAALIGFATLLSGSAIGFLISQVWFFWHNWRGGTLNISSLSSLESEVVKEFKMDKTKIKENDPKDTKRILDVFITYLLHQEKSPNRNGYIQRRLDIYQTLSCIVVAIIGATIIGLILRIYCEIYVFTWTWSIAMNGEFFAQAFFIPIIIGIAVILYFSRQIPLINYKTMLIAFIRNASNDEKNNELRLKVQKAFPDLFSNTDTILKDKEG